MSGLEARTDTNTPIGYCN